MNDQQFLHSLTDVDDVFIQEAAPVAPRTKHRLGGWKLVAVCAALIAAFAVTAAAVANVYTSLKKQHSSNENSGFSLEVKADLGYLSEFKSQKELQQMVQDDMNDPVTAGDSTVWLEFDTMAEAKTFLGLDKLIMPENDLNKTDKVTVRLFYLDDGEIVQVYINTTQNVDDIDLYLTTSIYLDEEDLHSAGMGQIGNFEYEEQFYTTPSGRECHIIVGTKASGGRDYTAYIVIDNILYSMHINMANFQSYEDCMAMVHKWADQF